MKQQLASGQGYTPYDTNHAPHTERTCPLVGSIGSCLKRSIFEDEFAQVRDRQLCIGNSLLALTAVLALAVVRHGKANLLVEISDNGAVLLQSLVACKLCLVRPGVALGVRLGVPTCSIPSFG